MPYGKKGLGEKKCFSAILLRTLNKFVYLRVGLLADFYEHVEKIISYFNTK
jgi:hypothetical protein